MIVVEEEDVSESQVQGVLDGRVAGALHVRACNVAALEVKRLDHRAEGESELAVQVVVTHRDGAEDARGMLHHLEIGVFPVLGDDGGVGVSTELHVLLVGELGFVRLCSGMIDENITSNDQAIPKIANPNTIIQIVAARRSGAFLLETMKIVKRAYLLDDRLPGAHEHPDQELGFFFGDSWMIKDTILPSGNVI